MISGYPRNPRSSCRSHRKGTTRAPRYWWRRDHEPFRHHREARPLPRRRRARACPHRRTAPTTAAARHRWRAGSSPARHREFPAAVQIRPQWTSTEPRGGRRRGHLAGDYAEAEPFHAVMFAPLPALRHPSGCVNRPYASHRTPGSPRPISRSERYSAHSVAGQAWEPVLTMLGRSPVRKNSWRPRRTTGIGTSTPARISERLPI